MFDSGIKVSDLIEQINGEADIAYDIPSTNYILWLNALEQLLYAEIIKEQGKTEVDINENNLFEPESLQVLEGQDKIRFEDIHAVYAGNTQLIKTTLASGRIFDNCYFKAMENKVGYRVKNTPSKLTVIYFVRPELKTADNFSEKNVMVPVEFIDLVTAKLRGEAYKLANEDSLAAKWLNDYNILLETFKAWISEKQAQFGL